MCCMPSGVDVQKVVAVAVMDGALRYNDSFVELPQVWYWE